MRNIILAAALVLATPGLADSWDVQMQVLNQDQQFQQMKMDQLGRDRSRIIQEQGDIPYAAPTTVPAVLPPAH